MDTIEDEIRRLRSANCRTARFWTQLNGSPVKIALRDGQRLAWQRFQRHEEGWSSEHELWARDGCVIVCDEASDGVDCDGRLSSHARYTTEIGRLGSGPQQDGVAFPLWTRQHSGRRDYAAEARGY